MADVDSRFSSNYSDEEENDKVLANYFQKTPDVELFRPTLADDQKIGFFSLDRNTQTEETEIIDLKEMTNVIQQLLEDTATMKRDINFARHVMKAEFESKLQQKALELYCRVNEKVEDIEKMQQERVATVRRAFKQQLSDAISRMHTYYTMKKEQNQKDGVVDKYKKKIKDMQSTIQRNESVIKMMKLQIETLQQEAEDRVEERPPSRTESVIAEIDGLNFEVKGLKGQVSNLEKELMNSNTTNQQLVYDMQKLRDQLEKEKETISQLKGERAELLSDQKSDKAAADRMLENQKTLWEKQMAAELEKAKQKALEEAKKEAESLQSQDQDKINKILEEKKRLELQLSKEREKASIKSKDAIDLEQARRNEEILMAQIARLKKEIERVHKTWEKKFAILQQSLHALKDESYVRQTMQRQAATLHQASISYAYDAPMGILPAKPPSNPTPPRKPLPNIGNKKSAQQDNAPDYISYTVSAPSGRATALLPNDENQVMSDNEQDLPPDVQPLPSPPPRKSQQNCAEQASSADSRPSTRSHVVVLPSAEVQ